MLTFTSDECLHEDSNASLTLTEGPGPGGGAFSDALPDAAGGGGSAWVLPEESPWTEEPGGLQSVGSQRVGHN